MYFEPYIPGYIAKPLFEFLRSELPYYRVEYDIKRGGISTHIRTPRYGLIFSILEITTERLPLTRTQMDHRLRLGRDIQIRRRWNRRRR